MSNFKNSVAKTYKERKASSLFFNKFNGLTFVILFALYLFTNIITISPFFIALYSIFATIILVVSMMLFMAALSVAAFIIGFVVYFIFSLFK
jgi:uncharacterized membrane protein